MEKVILLLEYKIGVLEKVIMVLTRNRVDISKLHITVQPNGEQSVLTLSAKISREVAAKLRLQMMRIIEVVEVTLLYNIQNI